jgi:hypothetical protein
MNVEAGSSRAIALIRSMGRAPWATDAAGTERVELAGRCLRAIGIGWVFAYA